MESNLLTGPHRVLSSQNTFSLDFFKVKSWNDEDDERQDKFSF